MKPRDLKKPFFWNKNYPFLYEGVFCVPQAPSEQRFSFFSKPLCVEFCSGNGEWIVQKSIENPDKNWLAVEKKWKRIQKIWSKKTNHLLKNLTPVYGMGEDLSQHFLEKASVQEIYINFPDPWPKRRHWKNRILHKPFVENLSQIAQKGCLLKIVTDDESYRDFILDNMQPNTSWRLKENTLIDDTYGSSYFRRLWEEKGFTIHSLEYERH